MTKRTIAYTLLFIISVICAAEYKANYIDYRPMKDILEELELTGSSMTITDELEKPELEENPRYKND